MRRKDEDIIIMINNGEEFYCEKESGIGDKVSKSKSGSERTVSLVRGCLWIVILNFSNEEESSS